MNPKEEENVATPRAGGDVIWKSASQAPVVEPAGENATATSPHDSDPEQRAACTGDGIFKGASQAEGNK
ncbi:MAG TPA: hypothetical protein VJT15_05900 [Pyrinomonadaceae bacterium]|nr:hypothetical protein [Pyrinomonadaceae bacterium]